MTKKTKTWDAVELLDLLKKAVVLREQTWDAERDIEMELGGDLDGLSEFIDDLAVAGADSLTTENVEDMLTSLDLVKFK